MSKRIKTLYPGVYFREARRIGGKGTEKVYYVVFKKDGKVYEERTGRQFMDGMTPARAARIRGERIEGKRQSKKEIREVEKALKDKEAGRWTIDRLWEEYKTTRPKNKGYFVDGNRYLKYLKPIFGKKEPKELINLEIDRLRIRLLKTLAPQTVKHILNLLTWIVNFGVKKNLCDGIPFHIQKPKVDNLKTEDLTPEQLKSLLDAIEQDDNIQAANLMRLALVTGMRRGELFNLKWSDIDDNRGFINIRDPKGGPDQRIPLNEAAGEVLNNHIRTDSEYIFPGTGGRKRSTISVPVNRIKARANLPADFRPLHGLRHVFASTLASSGEVDIYTLQRLLTHKDGRMTMRYAHLRDETLRKASNVASDIITKAANGKEKVAQIKERKEK